MENQSVTIPRELAVAIAALLCEMPAGKSARALVALDDLIAAGDAPKQSE